MEEEPNEHELEERLYSMLHYVDETQANIIPTKNALNIIENAPRSTVRRYWRDNEYYTANTPFNNPYRKVNTPKVAPKPAPKPTTDDPKPPKIATDDAKPKEEKCKSPVEALPSHLSLFQSPVPKNVKKTIEIIEHENSNVVELESSDEDEVIEVVVPPKPTITIESSDEDEIAKQNTPTKPKPAGQDKSSIRGEREISASPVPSVVSSISDDFIRGDCIAFNISSRRPDTHSFDFSLHGPDLLGSTPSKKKKKKKNKESATSTPIKVTTTQNKSTAVEECFATPKSKARNKKQKNKSYKVTEKSIPNADVYDSDSNQSIIEINKNPNPYVTSEKSVPCSDVYETESNPTETAKQVEKPKETQKRDLNISHSVILIDKSNEEPPKKMRKESIIQLIEPVTIDLTDNSALLESNDIEENIVMANVTGFTESEDYGTKPTITQDNPKMGSTKVPAILYENVDFDNLKGKEKVCKNRRYSLTTLRAEMEKFYNESWGGEDFNHREIQKNMSRDKSLWAIDPKDRMSSLSRKKYNVICNYCNRPGHRDDMCRQKPAVCYMCGNTGHMEPRCPRKICVNCGSPNHMYSTMCRNCAHWGRMTCVECGQVGHPASHCPDLWRRYHNTIDITSHLEENRFTKKHFQNFCSGCTRRGHLVHTCNISLPFSGLPINSPYVHMYRPIYAPVPDTNSENQHMQRQQRQPFKNFPQDSTISSDMTWTKNDHNKRQSKSPTVHETHVNKKRNMSMSEPELPARQATKSPVQQEKQRKRSQSKEPVLESQVVTNEQDQVPTTNATEPAEKALDFIPIFSSNHDKKGQVIQDNEVSDTSDVITSARIYITNEVVEKLKTKDGQDWIKETAGKLHVIVEETDITSFLSLKGKLGDQEAFQSALRDWTKHNSNTDHSKSDVEVDISQQSENDPPTMSHNIPKNRNKVLRQMSKALESLKENHGEPNALFKELNYLQGRHQHLLNQKEINPQQLSNNRGNINTMLRKLNLILLGQAGLADGSRHIHELYELQQKLINYRQKNISADMRNAIGQHYHCIFTATPRSDYGELIKSYNCKKTPPSKKKKKSFEARLKKKKFNIIPTQNQQMIQGINTSIKETKAQIISNETPIQPHVKTTMTKLVFYLKRLKQARLMDKILRQRRFKLVNRLQSHITSLSTNANAPLKSWKKIKKLQDEAQMFLNNV